MGNMKKEDLKKLETKYKRYIKTHKLKDFEVLWEDERYALWLVQTLTTPVKVKGDIVSTTYIEDYDWKTSIIKSAVRLDIKTLSIAIAIEGEEDHPNSDMDIMIDGEDFIIGCVGSMNNEVIDFDKMKVMFSLPFRGVGTLSRGAGDIWDDDDNELDDSEFGEGKAIDKVVWVV